jgi:hypothetical protein
MKIRLGFVSNSSSSSFVCDVSGRVESGWGMSIKDAEMCECEYGHCVGEEYIISEIDDMIEKEGVDKINEMVFAFYEIDDEDEKETMYFSDGNEFIRNVVNEVDDARYSLPAQFCPICSLHHISSYNTLEYLFKKSELLLTELQDEIRAKFSCLTQLQEWLKQ